MPAPLTVRAPLAGVVVRLADVPDPVFAAELVGPGLAIDPTGSGVVEAAAPIDGTVVKIHPHAFVVAAPDGRAVLVHLGLDTVELRGAGFEVLVAEGVPVGAGHVLVRWSPSDVAAGGRSPVCPVVALGADGADLAWACAVGTRVDAGDALLTWTH